MRKSKSKSYCTHFPHNFWMSYDYPIYCQSEIFASWVQVVKWTKIMLWYTKTIIVSVISLYYTHYCILKPLLFCWIFFHHKLLGFVSQCVLKNTHDFFFSQNSKLMYSFESLSLNTRQESRVVHFIMLAPNY